MWSSRRSLMLGLWTSSTNTIGLVCGLSFSGDSKDGATTRISIGEAIETFDTLTFIDASWYHKGDRNGRDEYLRGPRIANAVYYDLSSSSSSNSSGGDTLSGQTTRSPQPPAVSLAARQMDNLGITNHETNIVVYGQSGAFFLPRVWFTIRHLMGHQSCRLLDGTLDDWAAAGGEMDYRTMIPEKVVPTSATTSVVTDNGHSSSSYQPKYQPNVLIGLEEMKQFVVEERGVIWDARGSSFAKGHMPGAIHMPYSSLHDSNGRLLSTDRIATILPPLSPTADVVVTCGSGVSACTLFWALQELGHKGRVRVYNGSWSEWKMLDDVPKVLPAASSS
jgi:thiosulfate/3-mercaptopyruvate sulfurtransferase